LQTIAPSVSCCFVDTQSGIYPQDEANIITDFVISILDICSKCNNGYVINYGANE